MKKKSIILLKYFSMVLQNDPLLIKIFYASLLILYGGFVYAEGAPISLSLRHAEEIGLKNNVNIKIGQFDLEIANYEKK